MSLPHADPHRRFRDIAEWFSLALGLNTQAGELTRAPVGEVHSIEAVSLDGVLS